MNHIKLFEEFNTKENNNNDNNISLNIIEMTKENISTIAEKFQIGDLIWAKNMGGHGLVGLVVSKASKNEDDVTVYDIYYRGYNGDIISTREEDMQDIIEAEKIFYAENNGDLLHYPNIAKKINISVNSKYQQYIDDVQEDNL
jgi:hypothetical protein